MKQRLGFLSGSLRTSTRPAATTTGARAHILGTMRAFEMLGWEVEPFIIGDRMPRRWVTSGSGRGVRHRYSLALAADLMLPIVGFVNARWAWRKLGGRVDWVYERHNPFNTMGWTFKRHGVPWILEVNRDFLYEQMVLPGLARWLEIRAYEKCDVIVCVSETLKKIIVRETGITPAKVMVIPNAVDTAVFNPKTCEPKRVFDDFTVGYVGILEPRQGLELLIEAISELRAEGSEISTVMVGEGTMRAALEGLSHRLGIREHVAFVGRVRLEKVPRFIAGFDLGYSGQVLTGERDMYHSPLKLYEYLAMAKPVVASGFEDAGRVVRDEETGFLFQAGDKEDLKRALRRAYGSRNRLVEMGSNACKQVMSEHTWLARIREVISAVEARV